MNDRSPAYARGEPYRVWSHRMDANRFRQVARCSLDCDIRVQGCSCVEQRSPTSPAYQLDRERRAVRKIVVSAANADRAQAYWESNDLLVVELCSAMAYEVVGRVFRNPSSNDDGSENAVRIDVVTSSNTMRNARLLCRAKPSVRRVC